MDDDARRYEQEGYVVRRGFFTAEETARLREEVLSARPRYPSRLDRQGLVFRQHLYFHSPFLRSFLSSRRLVDLLKTYVGPDLWIRKDQAVLKTPAGAEFPWHQDNGYNGLRDAYHQLWIALTDMRPENGSLWLIPGSHRRGVLPHRLAGTHAVWEGDDRAQVPVTAAPGDVLLFSSLLLHRTGPNTTGADRIAYVVEYMSARHLDPDARSPYFMVARRGEPRPRFVNLYPGNLSPLNQARYLPWRLRRTFGRWYGLAYRVWKGKR